MSTRLTLEDLKTQHGSGEECGACHGTFATPAEVFSHSCPAITGSGQFQVVPNGFGGTTTRRVPGTAPAFRRSASTQGPRPATDKQVAFLRRLVAERQPDADEAFVQSVIDRGSARVSKAIDRLLEMPKVAPTPAAPKVRTNRFAGQCVECGSQVEAEAGTVQSGDEGWEVRHLEGECPVTEFPFPFGRYALDGEDDEVRFFAATSEGLFAQASDELHPVHPGAVAGIIEAIAADPIAAAIRYGREFERCGICGRGLTRKASRDAGIGPKCLARLEGM